MSDKSNNLVKFGLMFCVAVVGLIYLFQDAAPEDYHVSEKKLWLLSMLRADTRKIEGQYFVCVRTDKNSSALTCRKMQPEDSCRITKMGV